MKRRELLLLLGGALMTARGLRAQQKAMPVVDNLNSGSPGPYASFLAAFHHGLGETGYVEGQNVAVEYRWAEGSYDRLPALAADLVRRQVEVIAAEALPAARAAKNATTTIPIVFEVGSDPVEFDLIASLARPGGNLTGVSFLAVDLMPKRLELLSDLVPQVSAIVLLVNPNNANVEHVVRDEENAARAKGVQLTILKAATETEIDTAFATLVRSQTGLLVTPDSFFLSRREQLVALASHHAIPAIYPVREYAVEGGLISYGTSRTSVDRLLGIYAGKILKGAKPADLPVQQPTTFELVVNLKTAKELGLTIPPSILARADEVIE